MDWFTLGVYVVSTALYWLTKDDIEPPETAKVATPMSDEGVGVPVFWGTVTIDKPANVKFKFISKATSYSVFDIQDIICLGWVDAFHGMFVGDKLCPFCFPIYDQNWTFPVSADWYGYDISDKNPWGWRTAVPQIAYQKFPVGAQYQYYLGDVLMIRLDPDEYIADMNCKNSYIAMGHPELAPHPVPEEFREVIFPSNRFPDSTKIPNFNYLFMAFFYSAKFTSGVAGRAYKVSRYKHDLMGDVVPDVAWIYDYKQIFDPAEFPDVQDYVVIRYNEAFSPRGYNPMYILREILTSPLLSLKIPAENIHTESFDACAQTLFDERFAMNVSISDVQASSKSVIEDILTYVEGFMYEDLTDGKIHFKLARDDYDPALLDVVDEDTITSIDDYTHFFDGDKVPNCVEVRYVDRFSNKDFQTMVGYLQYGWDVEKNVRVMDDDNVARRGVFKETLDRKWVSTKELAYRIAERYLFMSSARLVRIKITGNNRLDKYNVGDVFKVSYQRLGFDGVVVRVFGKKISELADGAVELDCVEDIHGVKYSHHTPIPENPDSIPIIPRDNILIQEPTLFELMKFADITGLPLNWLIDGVIPYRFYVGRSDTSQSFYDMYYDDLSGSGYVKDETYARKTLSSEPPYILLDAPIQDYDDLQKADYPSLSEFPDRTIFLVDDELLILSCEDTIKRACYDSDLGFHETGVKVFIVSNLGYKEQYPYWDIRSFVVEDTVEYLAKIYVRSFGIDSNFNLAPQLQLSSLSPARYERPLNVTGLKINEILWKYSEVPKAISDADDLVLTWANKDRNLVSVTTNQGFAPIYTTNLNYNRCEEGVEIIIAVRDLSESVVKEIVIPYSTITPTDNNTKYTYTIADLMIDVPDGEGTITFSTRKPYPTPPNYVYSRVNRVISFVITGKDSIAPTCWLLYTRAMTEGTVTPAVYACKNVFYPDWYPSSFYLMTTADITGSTPPDPISQEVLGVFTGRKEYTGLSISDLLAKQFHTRTRAFSGYLGELNDITQINEFFPPKVVIKKTGVGTADIYVSSNTDLLSDWFDNRYNYELYLAYQYSWVANSPYSEDSPDKGAGGYPNMPIWSGNIKDYKIGRYDKIEVNSVPVANAILCISARGKAKLTRKSDSAVFWTNDYFVKSWQANISPEITDAYRCLEIFPRPTLTITEQAVQGNKYLYTISINADPSADWYNENWEWRLAGYTSTGTAKPDLDLDPSLDIVLSKTQSWTYLVNRSARLYWIVVCADIILDRAGDSYYSKNAKLTPQCYGEWTRGSIPIPDPVLQGVEWLDIYDNLWMEVSVSNQYDIDRGFGVSFRYTETWNTLPYLIAPEPPDPTITSSAFGLGSYVRLEWGSQEYPSQIYSIKIKILAQVWLDAGHTTYELTEIGYASWSRNNTPSD